MLVAYILTKSKFLKVKFVRLKDDAVFSCNKLEYNINRQRIYQKKFLGIKLFFWSMYLEGNPDPIEYKDSSYEIKDADVPLDEISTLAKKMRQTIYEKYIFLIMILNLLLTLGLFMKVFDMIK